MTADEMEPLSCVASVTNEAAFGASAPCTARSVATSSGEYVNPMPIPAIESGKTNDVMSASASTGARFGAALSHRQNKLCRCEESAAERSLHNTKSDEHRQ